MRLRNDREHYGLVAVTLHWLVALTVFGLFGLGLWMTGLTYYDPWYRQGPALHKSFGVVLFAVMLVRLAWRLYSPPPAPLASHTPLERRAAHLVHGLLYLLLFAIMASGYLISTADGRAVEVFGLFSIPATITSIPQQEDVAGAVHLTLAVTLMVLVLLHIAGALKHHFIDRDRTLRRMLAR
ncbi:MAG: cytochrome b [Thiohalomonadaceae bacterium]